MKKYWRVIATLLLLLLLGAVLWGGAKRCYDMERQACFDRLRGYAEAAGGEVRRTMQGARAYLERVSAMLARFDMTDREDVGHALSALGGVGMISRVELLLPGDRLLTGEGELLDVSGHLSFETALAAGAHVTRRSQDLLNPDALTVRCCVPVVQNGKTAAVICGVVDLATLPQLFSIESYQNKVQFYIVEGSTGNFLMDTWHSELGSVAALGRRQTKKGYYWKDFLSSLECGRTDTVIFLSQSVGKYFYAYTAPVGVADWMLTLNIPEEDVFAQADALLRTFYGLAVLLFVLFILYFFWMLRDIRQEGLRSERQLQNVSYMLDVEKALFDAHMRPERFSAALRIVADFLGAECAFFRLIEGQPDISPRLWSSGETESCPQLQQLLPDLFSQLRVRGGVQGYSMSALAQELPEWEAAIVRLPLQSLMLVPVTGSDDSLTFVLGACNLRRRWESTAPLERVSLSFFMSISHYGVYLSLNRMGQTDSLTSLMNRNSYQSALAALEREKPSSLGCVYVDANGLHEINNHLGHQVGDEMLMTVASALQRNFPNDGVYRIGGDEFVVLCRGREREDVRRRSEQARQILSEQDCEISVGVEWGSQNEEVRSIIRRAEVAMRRDKQRYYQESGRERQMRSLNQQLEQMILEKQDADTFLSILAPEFKGVYFVDLKRDTVRHLYIPPYFEEILRESNDVFSRALLRYAQKFAKPEYHPHFRQICDYQALERRLNGGSPAEFIYQKRDGVWLQLRVLKFRNYTEERRETLWIFAAASVPAAYQSDP